MTLAHQFARALTPDKQAALDQMRAEFDDPESTLLVQCAMERERIPENGIERAWDFVQWCAGRNSNAT